MTDAPSPRCSSGSADLLALADEYEAGLKKMLASGYEEFGPDVLRKHRMTIDALRFHASATLIEQEASDPAYSAAGCDHSWKSDGGRGSGSMSVITCEKCGVLRKASDSPAWSKGDGRPVTTTFDEVHCKDEDDCDWPECDCPKRPKGGFACPICGSETPHHHAEAEVALRKEAQRIYYADADHHPVYRRIFIEGGLFALASPVSSTSREHPHPELSHSEEE